MFSPFELVNTASQSKIDVTLKFASTIADCTRRLLNLQLDVAAEVTHGSIENLHALLTKPATVDSFKSWQSAWQSHIDRIQEIGRSYFAEVSQMQEEITKCMGEPGAEMDKSAITNSKGWTETGQEEKEKPAAEHSSKTRRAPRG